MKYKDSQITSDKNFKAVNFLAKSVRMSDIAEKLQVSTVTVSKALAGKDGVSEELRIKIQQLAEEMGYRKKIGKSDGTSDFSNIGVIISGQYIEKGHSFYWTLYERILYHLSMIGCLGILEIVPDLTEQKVQLPRIAQDGRVDGIILVGSFPDRFRNALASSGVPFVILDSYHAKYKQDSVISDGYYGMYTVVQYLQQMGHRRIMFVGTVGATASITDRYYGYCRAMMEAGIAVSDDMVLPDRDENNNITLSLDAIKQMPTAFACNCDNTAHKLLTTLKERGIRVPQDVSVTGFDNFIVSELSTPGITTYGVDVDMMAQESVAQLIRRLKTPNAALQHIIVSGSLLVRDSVQRIS